MEVRPEIKAGPQEGVCNWCNQLGGKACRKGGSRAVIWSPEKNPLQTSGGAFCGYLKHFGAVTCMAPFIHCFRCKLIQSRTLS